MSIVMYYCSVDRETLDQLIAEPGKIEQAIMSAPSDVSTNVDKEWEAIHFVLTGDIVEGDGPRASVIHGGIPFGPDHGCGSVRYLTPDVVKAVASALEEVTGEELRLGFKPELMEDVYPEGKWCDPDSDYTFESLLDQMDQLQDFYSRAASDNRAVLIWAG